VMLFQRRFAGLGFAFNHLDHTVNSRSEALTDFPACQEAEERQFANRLYIYQGFRI
jgi:hypothetical protein